MGVRIEMPAGIPQSARPVLERAAWTCPVHESLHAELKQDVTFVWK
jgi:putative redox protein